jgi:hypothetical protein
MKNLDRAIRQVRVSRRVGQTEGGGIKGDNKGVVLRLSITLVILQSDSQVENDLLIFVK